MMIMAGRQKVKMPSFEAYRDGFWTALSRQHHPEFSWRRLRPVCVCGRDLPCSVKAEAIKAMGEW
jgi:hypothetical protein